MNLADQYVQRCDTPSDIVDHLPYLYDQACRFPGAQILELGTRAGNSTSAFLAAAEKVGGHVYSIDVNNPRTPDWWRDLDCWSLHIGDDLSSNAQQFAPDTIDVLFIDTSHSYGHTLGELETYFARCTGVVLLHDTELESPEGFESGPKFPVAKAITEFCEANDLEWVNRPGCYGLGVIEVRDGDR